MSWNGSNAGAARAAGARGASGANPRRGDAAGRGASGGGGLKVALGLVLCAAVLGGAWWWLGGRETPLPVPNHAEPAAKPAKSKPRLAMPTVTNVARVASVADRKQPPYWELDESHTNGFSEAQMRKWRNVRRPRMKPFTRERPKARYEIFDHRSENMIACLLAAKPGTGFIGTPNYKDIDADFLKSCERPIIVTEDDDEYSADLKRQMVEVKIGIKERMDAGESLADILQTTREEMRKLASYRQGLAEEIRKIEKSGESAEAVKDFVDAANRLLAEKGIAPISPGPITMSRLKHLNKEGEGK